MTVGDWIRAAEQHWGTMHDPSRRTRMAAIIRHAVWYAMRETTTLTYKSIGALCDGKEHSTVVWGIAKAMRFMAAGDAMWCAWRDIVDRQGRVARARKDAHGLDYLDLITGELVTRAGRAPAGPMGSILTRYRTLEHNRAGTRLYLEALS